MSSEYLSVQVNVGKECSYDVEVVPDTWSLQRFIELKSTQENVPEAFCVINLGEIPRLYDLWKRALPRVTPFYAVKAFSDPIILKILAQLGTGFECATLNEIKKVLDVGVSPNRIIFAHPCKLVSHLKFAAEKGVKLMTFDSLSELRKIKKYFPSAELVIRLLVENKNASWPMIKFGCALPDTRDLLEQARSMDLNVVGVSFMVGSGFELGPVFRTAIEMCAQVFEEAASVGFRFTLLDIGAGYPGADKLELFLEEADTIKQSLQAHFNKDNFQNLEVIGEPGRFFSATLAAEAVRVCGTQFHHGNNGPQRSYFVSDSIHVGLAMTQLDRFHTYTPKVLKSMDEGCPTSKTILWGASCDPLDKVCEVDLPELEVGDWLYFETMGAYSRALCTAFNGLSPPHNYYYIRHSDRVILFKNDFK